MLTDEFADVFADGSWAAWRRRWLALLSQPEPTRERARAALRSEVGGLGAEENGRGLQARLRYLTQRAAADEHSSGNQLAELLILS